MTPLHALAMKSSGVGRRGGGDGRRFNQVWSPTHFYFADFAIEDCCKKGVFINTQPKFASAVIDGVIGPPRLVQHY